MKRKMKRKEIKVGGIYVAKVNGKLTKVRVDAARIVYRPRLGVHYDVTNIATGRQTTFRSAAKFREQVWPEPVTNIPDGTPGPKALSDLFRI